MAPSTGARAYARPAMTREPVHLSCPFCGAYEVDRLYLASTHVDACACGACGARWDQDAATGRFRGRAPRESALDA